MPERFAGIFHSSEGKEEKNMKKKILGIITIIVMAGAVFGQTAFAAGQLELVSAFPEDGGTGYQTINQMARLVFSQPIEVTENESCFRVVDGEGKEQPIMVLEQEDEPERVNLLFENELDQNTEYEILIDGALTDTQGNQLGEDVSISFKTKNAKTESLVTTVLMILMFVVIIFITFREQAKMQQEQQEAGKKVNPYKEAKREAEKRLAQRKKERDQKIEQYQKQMAQKRGEQTGQSQISGQGQKAGQNKNKSKKKK